ncbi:MAG: hypothetical protein ACLTE4_00385 [Christensenellaceae bacterium]
MRSGWKDIRSKKTGFFFILLLAVCILLCGCTQTEQREDKVKVSIVDSLFFTASTPTGEVETGGDFRTELSIRAGYEIASCDYSEYTTEKRGTKTVLTLKNVSRPSRVTVECRKATGQDTVEIDLKCTIKYIFNGGTDGGGAEESTVDYSLTEHLRPNTINGADITRQGYVLTGWNTRADGKGEHIGLGSRVTVADGETATLYAEWEKSLDESQLLYKEVAKDAVTLTGYRGKGDIQPFVIPSEIGGRKVVEISSSFTTNMPCGTLSSKTLVLPNTIKFVKSNSFLHSSFSELYFSDNIEDIDEKAFPYNIKTLHINAVREPCFQAVNNSTIFSDNMDRLILNADKKKLIFFSGCSFAYGVCSDAVNDVYGDDYVVFNMGMNGDINAAFQMDIMVNYIGKDDVFVHAPEEMSPSQLMFSYFVNNIMFIMVEGNYDLLSLADFSDNGGVLRAFFDYIELKDEMEPCSYSDGRYEDFNIYGDYIYERPYDESTENERDVTYSDNAYCYAPELLTDSGIEKLVGYYDAIEAKGGKVYLSYAPVNISARGGTEIEEKGYEFAEKFEGMLSVYGYEFISEVEDYMFLGRYFYDSDYHLNDLGASLRTERLISDLQAAGV